MFLREIHVSMQPKEAERLLYWGKWSPKKQLYVSLFMGNIFLAHKLAKKC